MKRLVKTTYLEMREPGQLRPAKSGYDRFQLIQSEIASPEFNRFLYAGVGAEWFWTSRLSWTDTDWLAHLNRPETEIWVAHVSGTPAGYFELEFQNDKRVEVVYFGLLPTFIGTGIGGAFLTTAISRAWDMGAERVWVHTCTLDHPKALQNYQDRGFKIFHTEEAMEEIPEAFS